MRKILFLSFLKLLFLSQLVLGQQTITGTVTSSQDGSTLPGVNITVKGTTTGVVSDLDGNYTITVNDPEAILVFSFVGYHPFETVVGTRSNLNVVLEEGSELLDEIVVIGYGETTRKSFTGSLTSIGAEEVANIPQQNVISMMQGRAAGVYVTDSDGQPGSSPSILIRGLGTFRGSGSPLYVIDGIPASNFNSFNPNDIESITFLKDAAATSIYGSRAASGVVLITTKKGRAGKTIFNLNAQFGSTSIENPNDFRLLDGPEYLTYYREAAMNAGIDPEDPAGPAYYPLTGNYYNTDWFDAVTRKGQIQSYELSASGGNENTTFYFSFGYFDEIGTVIGSSFDRYTGRLNLKHKVSDKLDFDIKVFGSVNNKFDEWGGGGGRSGNMSGSYSVSPLKSPYADENTPFVYNGAGFNFDLQRSNAGHNPVAVAELTKNYYEEYRTLPSVRINYSPISNLKFWASASYDFRYATRKEFMSKFYLAETEGGVGEQTWYQDISANYNAVAEYSYNINDLHSIKFLVGGEAYKRVGEDADAGSESFGFDAINNFAGGGTTSMGYLDYNYDGSTLLSVFSRADYTFSDKLFVHGSFRRDGSSVFGPGNRWGNFYAFGVGYSMTDEPFIQSIELISNFKVKASYGIAGNPNSGDFEWRNTYSPGGAYNLPGSPNPGTVINNPGNPNLKWEQSSQANIGFDIGILNDRVMASLEYYDIRSIDLISNRPISVTSGYTSIIDNIAEIKNNGIEVLITTANVSTPDFVWTTSFNITKNWNEVVSLTNDVDTLIVSNSVAHITGQPAYQWFMPTYAGVDPATGRALYYDADGATTFNYSNAEVKVQGTNPIYAPDFYGGITNSLTYKGFNLSFLFYFQYGGKIYRSLYQDLMRSGGAGGSNQSVDGLDRWQNPGDITDVPKLDATNSDPGPLSRWLEDASYIRLRNIDLTYSLPANIASKLGMSNLAFSVRGINLLTFTAYNGLNVTVGSRESSGDYPVPRTITFGINARF